MNMKDARIPTGFITEPSISTPSVLRKYSVSPTILCPVTEPEKQSVTTSELTRRS